MPNSCNQGSCGTCKVKLRSGRVDHRASPLETLSAAERAEGYALACQATVLEDVVVEPSKEEDEPPGTNKLVDLAATVTEMRDVARHTRQVLLTLDEPLTFSPGQYVEISVPGADVRRQYSLANAPSEAKSLELHVRRRVGGLASDAWVFGTMSVGDRVEVTGPLGDFTFDDQTAGPIVMLAGGTGLAPMKSMLLQALRNDPGREITLYHGVRSREDLYDTEFYRAREEGHPGFRFVTCLSRDDGGDRSGYVTDAFLADVQSAKECIGYVCGSEGFVESAVRALKRRRMSPRRIHRERFTPAMR